MFNVSDVLFRADMRRFGARHSVLCLLGIAVVFITAESGHADSDSFKPRFNEAFIESGKSVVRPVRVSAGWQSLHLVGDARFVLDGSSLSITPKAGDATTTDSPDDMCWRWLTSDDRFAYLTAVNPTPWRKTESSDDRVRICRFDGRSGRLDGEILIVPDEKPSGEWRTVVLQAITRNDQLVVMTAVAQNELFSRGLKLDSYRVTSFRDHGKSQEWTRKFRSTGNRQEPRAGLLCAAQPNYADSSIRHLSWLGNNLLVCAGPVQPIQCLYGHAGGRDWVCERVWDFRRDFIGPSIWQHFMTGPDTDPPFPAKQSVVEKDLVCAIVGGPIVLDGKDESQQRIFVAVAKSPKHEYAGYLADCVVYELGFNGRPIAMMNVPRMIRGNRYSIHQGGIVWACEENAFLRIEPSKQAEFFGTGGMGQPDCIGLINWYRQLVAPSHDAWLGSDLRKGPIAFTKDHAFVFRSGGEVLREGDSRFHFAIQALNLRDGAINNLTFVVPFAGKALPPTMNYSTRYLPDGSMRHRALGVHLLGVCNLDVLGDELRVGVIGTTEKVALRFRTTDLVESLKSD